jgi:hypothetical protein
MIKVSNSILNDSKFSKKKIILQDEVPFSTNDKIEVNLVFPWKQKLTLSEKKENSKEKEKDEIKKTIKLDSFDLNGKKKDKKISVDAILNVKNFNTLNFEFELDSNDKVVIPFIYNVKYPKTLSHLDKLEF